MITKIFKADRAIKLEIKDNGYTYVFKNGKIEAHLTCEEEARRFIWLGLKLKNEKENTRLKRKEPPVTDDMFEVVTKL